MWAGIEDDNTVFVPIWPTERGVSRTCRYDVSWRPMGTDAWEVLAKDMRIPDQETCRLDDLLVAKDYADHADKLADEDETEEKDVVRAIWITTPEEFDRMTEPRPEGLYLMPENSIEG